MQIGMWRMRRLYQQVDPREALRHELGALFKAARAKPPPALIAEPAPTVELDSTGKTTESEQPKTNKYGDPIE